MNFLQCCQSWEDYLRRLSIPKNILLRRSSSISPLVRFFCQAAVPVAPNDFVCLDGSEAAWNILGQPFFGLFLVKASGDFHFLVGFLSSQEELVILNGWVMLLSRVSAWDAWDKFEPLVLKQLCTACVFQAGLLHRLVQSESPGHSEFAFCDLLMTLVKRNTNKWYVFFGPMESMFWGWNNERDAVQRHCLQIGLSRDLPGLRRWGLDWVLISEGRGSTVGGN